MAMDAEPDRRNGSLTMRARPTDLLAEVLTYIRRGWAPVPVPFRQKGPTLKDWQHCG